MPDGYTLIEKFLPAHWPNASKWQLITGLLADAASVEVLKTEGGYTLRVWYAA